MKSATKPLGYAAKIITLAQRCAAVFFRFYVRQNGGYTLQNMPNLRHDVTYMFIANHQSRIDPFTIFASLPQPEVIKVLPLRFMAARSIYYSPILPLLKLLGCYPTRQPGKDVIARSVSYLQEGYCVFMFPEGRRVLRSESDPRSGIERILANAPDNVQPILVHIEWTLLKRGRRHVTVSLREASMGELRSLPAKDIMQMVYEVE